MTSTNVDRPKNILNDFRYLPVDRPREISQMTCTYVPMDRSRNISYDKQISPKVDKIGYIEVHRFRAILDDI